MELYVISRPCTALSGLCEAVQGFIIRPDRAFCFLKALHDFIGPSYNEALESFFIMPYRASYVISGP